MSSEESAGPTIFERTKTAFSGEKGKAEDYIVTIRENWREALSSMGKTAIIVMILIFVFELLTRSAVQKISFAGFEVQDLALIHKALPVLIAYFSYDLVSVTLLQGDYRIIHGELIKIIDRDLWDTDLHKFLWPRTPSFLWTTRPGRRETKLDNLFLGSLNAAVIFAGILFESYAFYTLFRLFGFTDVTVWLALIIGICFVVYSIIRILRDRDYKQITARTNGRGKVPTQE